MIMTPARGCVHKPPCEAPHGLPSCQDLENSVTHNVSEINFSEIVGHVTHICLPQTPSLSFFAFDYFDYSSHLRCSLQLYLLYTVH